MPASICIYISSKKCVYVRLCVPICLHVSDASPFRCLAQLLSNIQGFLTVLIAWFGENMARARARSGVKVLGLLNKIPYS